MNTKNKSSLIHNLKIISSSSTQLNDNFIITSTSPFKSKIIYSIKPKKIYAYTNKKIKIKISPLSTYKGYFSPYKSSYNNGYKSIYNKIDLNKNKKLKNIFPKICLYTDKTKDKTQYNRVNKTENKIKNNLFSSIFKITKTFKKNKNFLKKENLHFMKEKKSEIHNIHKKIMRNNKMHILLKQNTDLNENRDKNKRVNNNKFSYISLTEESKACFEKEYNKICKNKLKAKKLIEKEITNVGKQLSWIKILKNNERVERIKNNCEKKITETNNNLMSTEFAKKMRGKDPVLEINQTSSFPVLSVDPKIISNLWKKDMIKFCKYGFDIDKTKDIQFVNDLLDVYD